LISKVTRNELLDGISDLPRTVKKKKWGEEKEKKAAAV
jgi:hypothetical protein